jgi:acetyl esterase/lipase
MDNNITDMRSNFDSLGKKYKPAENVKVEKEFLEEVPCYWFYTGKAKSTSRVFIYLHGGCYALGSINSYKALVTHLVKETEVTVLFIEYGLAPENPYPAAINEVLKVYYYLAGKSIIQAISFIGDSAGAGIIVSVISILNRKRNTKNLSQVVMISPWVDLKNNSDSVRKNKDIDPILTKEALDSFTSLYIGNNNVDEINPIEERLSSFPPTLILVGTNEILLDDAKTMQTKIEAIQLTTKLTIYENQVHGWPLLDIQSEATKRAINEIKQFIMSGQ